MEELSDKDFDQIFKNKVTDSNLVFEEASWLKMEKKLRKRDRFVFFRNASIILLFLSFGVGLYLMSSEELATGEIKVAEKVKSGGANKEAIAGKTTEQPKNQQNLIESDSKIAYIVPNIDRNHIALLKNNPSLLKQEMISKSMLSVTNQPGAMDSTIIVQKQVIPQNSQAILAQEPTSTTTNEILNNEKLSTPQKTDAKKPKFPVALSINVGPDFNSTKNTIGGKSSLALGIGVSVGLSRKLSVQTGANYGAKNYKAKGYDYTFNNPNTVNIISGIEAACKVIEVPLRVSYSLTDNPKNSVDINAGLSSYFMLKENYRFIYTAAAARKDRFLEKENANQHYLSVIDLSATYNIKLKNKKFALGVQPYVKIPISGIGEGSVPLKSSGISLKLNYELNKKN